MEHSGARWADNGWVSKGLGHSGRGLVGMAVVGALVAPATGLTIGWRYAAIVAWAAMCAAYLARAWLVVWPLDAQATAQHAALEDPSRRVADALLVAASIACLVDVVVVLATVHGLPAWRGVVHAAGALASLALSWAMVHTVFMLRYARMYVAAGGGIDFNGPNPPDYHDFAYLAFTVGMTYQISDTNLTDPAIRRQVLKHALLSFLFGTVVLAAAVNLVVGLVP
jgi:uncharacterized membrane protein